MSTSPTLRRRITRRLWLPVGAAIVAAAVAALVSGGLGRPAATYESTALLLAHSTSDDVRQAPTYASLLEHDAGLLAHVAGEVGVPAATVDDDLVAQSITNTSIIEVTYTSENADQAARAVRAIVADVTAKQPQATAITPGSFELVQPATEATESGSTRLPTVPLAALLGLIVGAVAAIALDRTDPRADDVTDLARVSGPLAVGTGPGAVSDVASLLRGWHRSTDGVPVVALVPVPDGRGNAGPTSPAQANAHDLLADAADAAALPAPQVVASSVQDATLAVSAADRSVLVVRRGTPLSRVRDLQDRLLATGGVADLTVLVPRRRSGRRSDTADHPVHDVGWLLEQAAPGSDPAAASVGSHASSTGAGSTGSVGTIDLADDRPIELPTGRRPPAQP